jgi:hypothetical protein
MGMSRATPRDLEYSKAYVEDHLLLKLPNSRHWQLYDRVASAGAAVIATVPILWVFRLLGRRAGTWSRLILLSLGAATASCALVAAEWFVALGRQARELERQAEAVHLRARAAVLSAESGTGCFALFARNFDYERAHPTPLPWGTYVNRLALEQGLARILGGRMPIVTIANPGADIPAQLVSSGILRLFVEVERWQSVFRRLAARAALILILDENDTGPGFLYELSVIEELRRQADSIVITDEDFRVLTYGDHHRSFRLEDYEDKVAKIRELVAEEAAEEAREDDEEPGLDEEQQDPLVTDLLARIAGEAESGLLRLRERIESGTL